MPYSNTIKVFDKVNSATMAKEQCKDPVLGPVYLYMMAGDKFKPAIVVK